MKSKTGLFLFAGLLLSSPQPADGEEAPRPKDSYALIFAETEGHAPLHSQAADSAFPTSVVFQLIPNEEADGSRLVPMGVPYLQAKRFPAEGDLDWLSLFPILKQITLDQEVSAKIFAGVKDAPHTLLAWLPGGQFPIVNDRISIKHGHHYVIKVPEFVPVVLHMDSFRGQDVVQGEWIIAAFVDRNLKLCITTDGDLERGFAWFWALAGHTYSGWLVPASEMSLLGDGAKGFELEEWTVAKGVKKGAKFTMKLKNPTAGMALIPNEGKP